MITIRKIKEKLASYGVATWLHILLSLIIAQVVIRLTVPFAYDAFLPKVIAFFVALIVGIAIEVYDSYQRDDTFDAKDLLSDIIGAVTGILLMI